MYDKSVKDTGAFENMLERYSMSLLGGTIGGGLFYGVEKYKGFNKTRDKDLVTLINEGKAQELRNLVKGYVSKGILKSQELSILRMLQVILPGLVQIRMKNLRINRQVIE